MADYGSQVASVGLSASRVESRDTVARRRVVSWLLEAVSSHAVAHILSGHPGVVAQQHVCTARCQRRGLVNRGTLIGSNGQGVEPLFGTV